MKKIIMTAAAVFAFAFANAQDSNSGGMTFGIKAGYVNSNFTGDIETDANSSAYFGGLVDFSISDKFHVQPELLYSMEGSSDDGAGLDFISIPIMAKYYVTKNLNIQAGPQIAFVAGGDDVKDNVKSTDFRLGFGAAYELDGGLFIDARYNMGMTDISDTDGFEVKTQSFNLGLGYRF
ncbi:MAG: porin family protein [Flavobacterium sp.]